MTIPIGIAILIDLKIFQMKVFGEGDSYATGGTGNASSII